MQNQEYTYYSNLDDVITLGYRYGKLNVDIVKVLTRLPARPH